MTNNIIGQECSPLRSGLRSNSEITFNITISTTDNKRLGKTVVDDRNKHLCNGNNIDLNQLNNRMLILFLQWLLYTKYYINYYVRIKIKYFYNIIKVFNFNSYVLSAPAISFSWTITGKKSKQTRGSYLFNLFHNY